MSGERKNRIKNQTFQKNWGAFKLLTTIRLIKNATFQRNLDTFKLLITYDKFQNDIKPICEQLSVAKRQLENNEISIFDYGALLSESNLAILKKYNIPFHFRPALSIYLQTREISEKDIPNRNYDFRFKPRSITRLKVGSNREIIEPVWTVQLETYTQLTEEEFEEAIRSLKRIQSMAFPKTKLFQRLNARKNIGKELEVEKRGNTRQRPITQEIFIGSYLRIIKKQFDQGKISPQEFKRIKKLNLKTIEKVKKGYTAKEISEELNLSPSSVRQTILRLKKERCDRFIQKRVTKNK